MNVDKKWLLLRLWISDWKKVSSVGAAGRCTICVGLPRTCWVGPSGKLGGMTATVDPTRSKQYNVSVHYEFTTPHALSFFIFQIMSQKMASNSNCIKMHIKG